MSEEEFVDLDPFQVLNVSETSSENEIRSSYHKLALQLHPDKTLDDSSVQFRRVAWAWKVLCDEESRKKALQLRLVRNRTEKEEINSARRTLAEFECLPCGTYVLKCRCGGNYEVISSLYL